MAKVPNGVETLRKISIAWVGCTNVTDDRQTDDRQTYRQTDGRRHIANMNMSSRSLKSWCTVIMLTLTAPFSDGVANAAGMPVCGLYGLLLIVYRDQGHQEFNHQIKRWSQLVTTKSCLAWLWSL